MSLIFYLLMKIIKIIKIIILIKELLLNFIDYSFNKYYNICIFKCIINFVKYLILIIN